MLGAEHAATVVGFLRAHREHVRHLVAPSPGVRQCGSSSCNSYTPRFHTPLLHPFSGRRFSLRCQDSSFPNQTHGIVFAEHFRRRAAGERGPVAACGLRIPRTLEVIHLKRHRFARITPGRSSLGPRL